MDLATLVTLTLTVEPATWPAAASRDISFRLQLTNRGPKKIELYPGAAQLSQRSGWSGPSIHLAIRDAASAEMPIKELRTWYGPPGMMPNASVFKPHRKRLGKDESIEHRINACFLPRALLREEQLSPQVIDPEGMDGIRKTGRPIPDLPPELAKDPKFAQSLIPLEERFPIGKASVLVLGRTCAELDKAKARMDFLRGEVVAFLPGAGLYDFEEITLP